MDTPIGMLKLAQNKLRTADLFAGIGGIRLAFEQAGFETVYANEIDRFACETYRANFGDLDQRDIKEVSSDVIPDFDVLLAGFPCQPFSRAGYEKGFDDPRGNLFFEVERILRDKRPRAFFLENVKHLKSHRSGETFGIIRSILENKLGYTLFYKVLNSSYYGQPQNRERIYIVGFREPVRFEFPEPTGRKLKVKDVLEKEVPGKYFLSQKYMECLLNHRIRHRAQGHGFGCEVLESDGIANSLTVGRMGRERNLIKEKVRKGFYNGGENKTLKNSHGLRMLTVRECTRLQGFPDSFVFPVSDTQAYKQLGNTVSVPVVKLIAEKIRETLKDKLLTQKWMGQAATFSSVSIP